MTECLFSGTKKRQMSWHPVWNLAPFLTLLEYPTWVEKGSLTSSKRLYQSRPTIRSINGTSDVQFDRGTRSKMAEEEQTLNNTEEETENETKQEESQDTTEESQTEESGARSGAKKSAKKSPAKAPVKAVKAKPKIQKKVSSDEEDESDDEELVGTLDAPLVIEGKRERKSTDFLVSVSQSTEKKKLEIPEGKGDTLGSMSRVDQQLSRVVADELKPLHRLLFGKPGAKHEVKRNIRCFNGFDIEKDSQEYKKKEEQVDRFTFDSLKRLCEILDVSRKGKKDEMVTRVMDFLMKPKASENPDKEKPKTSSRKQSATKRKRSTKDGKTRSSKKKVEDKADSDEEEEEDEEEDEEKEEEKEKEPPRKKTKSPERKKETKAKTDSKKSSKKDKKVVSIKISPGKKPKKGKAAKGDSDSSDDEPLAKKAKKSSPTDDEIVELVKDLLDGADLEKVTMKSVCRQVYDRFPEFDLSDRKEFIKDTVKEIIT